MSIYNLVSFMGIFILMGVGWLLSPNKRVLNWRLICGGIGLQLFFAVFVFWVPWGRDFFWAVNEIAVTVIDSAKAGSEFLFGPLALGPGSDKPGVGNSIGFILAFQAFPTIIFFSAFISLLYFARIMPVIIKSFAWLFTKLFNVSGAEAVCASSNIFVGIESSLTIKPFLGKMTKSELCTILTVGMASVASNVLGLYVLFLKPYFPTIAGHLISASILSAPAALVMSKIIFPETESPVTKGSKIDLHIEPESGVFECIINGANSGVKLIVGISALLIAVLGLVSLGDKILVWGGEGVNAILSANIDWSLKGLMGYCFYPLTIVMGIPSVDAVDIAKVIGERVIVTEVASYIDLSALMKSGSLQHGRSAFIATYALCGFAHLASMAIFVGGTAALVPERKKDLAQMGFRALAAATLACLMTGCVAGAFYTDSIGSILMGK